MIRLYVLDVPEFRPVIEEAQREAESHRRVGYYYEFLNEGPLVLDRHRAQSRKAVWFSSIGALRGGVVTQFDFDAIAIAPGPDDGLNLVSEPALASI